MAGDIKGKYGASAAFTVTNLHSLAASSTFVAGWTSASVDSASNDVIDYQVSCTFSSAASNRQAGDIRLYAYSALNDTPTWPDLFSSGTEGTEGAATVHSAEGRSAGMRLIKNIACNSTASEVYTYTAGIAELFSMRIVPQDWALFVTHDISTTTTAGFAASGSAISRTPILAQYT